MRVFRKNFLREGEIEIIPLGGYRCKDNQSRKAQWLIWMEHEFGHSIIHAGRGREYRIVSMPIRYYEVKSADEMLYYQFHDCF